MRIVPIAKQIDALREIVELIEGNFDDKWAKDMTKALTEAVTTLTALRAGIIAFQSVRDDIELGELENAALKAGTQAMTDLNNLSVGIIEIFYPNFRKDGIAPMCSVVDMVKMEVSKLRGEREINEHD